MSPPVCCSCAACGLYYSGAVPLGARLLSILALPSIIAACALQTRRPPQRPTGPGLAGDSKAEHPKGGIGRSRCRRAQRVAPPGRMHRAGTPEFRHWPCVVRRRGILEPSRQATQRPSCCQDIGKRIQPEAAARLRRARKIAANVIQASRDGSMGKLPATARHSTYRLRAMAACYPSTSTTRGELNRASWVALPVLGVGPLARLASAHSHPTPSAHTCLSLHMCKPP